MIILLLSIDSIIIIIIIFHTIYTEREVQNIVVIDDDL